MRASRRHAALAALVLLAACGLVSPTPIPTPSAPSDATPTPPADLLPDPGRPFDADDILAAMRNSRRPGGVPDELETDPIATAVAEGIWTYDGEPWPQIVAGGSCGPEACTLEIAGAPPGAVGEDLYSFSVTPETSTVDPVSADLQGMSTGVLSELDSMTRPLIDDPSSIVELLSARWLPPPDAGRFVLAYRSGGEEGSCMLNVTLDAATRRVVSQEAIHC